MYVCSLMLCNYGGGHSRKLAQLKRKLKFVSSCLLVKNQHEDLLRNDSVDFSRNPSKRKKKLIRATFTFLRYDVRAQRDGYSSTVWTRRTGFELQCTQRTFLVVQNTSKSDVIRCNGQLHFFFTFVSCEAVFGLSQHKVCNKKMTAFY